MLTRRKLKIAAVTFGCMVAVLGLAALPNASADGCTVTVTVSLPTGPETLVFQNIAPGTPPTALPIPPGAAITNVSQSCPPVTATTPAATVTATTPAPTTSTSTSTPTSTSTTPKPKPKPKPKQGSATTTTSGTTTPTTTTQTSPGKRQKTLNRGTSQAGKNLTQPGAPKAKHKKPSKAKKPATPPPPVTKSGVPTPSNPTFSFALPGPAPIGVPNFFIESFQIPPFLLPIYQAAGIQYNVPWQVLAAINEIETDYGRNLSVSTAGAVGWMQFLPSTWKRWGVDANGDGIADPYNPADAIFSAARYLHAAGASKNVGNAVFAYNHAGWYVQSVLLRAELIGGMPKSFIGSLTDLVQGHFPVAAPAKYADDAVLKLAKTRVKKGNAAVTVQSDPGSKGTAIYAKQGSPVIAVNDGKVVKIGQSKQLGRYVELQDATGNIYTYANLGSIPVALSGPQAGQGERHLDRQGVARAGQPRAQPGCQRRHAAGHVGAEHGQGDPGDQAPDHARDRRHPGPPPPARSPPPPAPRPPAPAPSPPPPRRRPPRPPPPRALPPSAPRWSRSGCSPTRSARPPSPPAASCRSRPPLRRSRASATTSPTCCTWPRTSTRSSP